MDSPSSQLDQREMSRKALARARSELVGLRKQLTTIDDAYRSGPPSDMASAAVAATHNDREDSTAKSNAFPASIDAVTTEVTAVTPGLRHEAHRAEIAAIKRRAATASAPRLAAESASILAHANIEIESANTEIARLAAELTSMRTSHEAEVAALRERVGSTASKNAALESECARLRRLLAETTAMADSHSTAARSAKDLSGKTQAAAELVEEEASRLERETAGALEELQRQHAEAIVGHGALKREMITERVEAIGALKIEHAESMMAVQSQHDEAVRALRSNHSEELKRVRAAHEQQVSVQQQAHESAVAALTNVLRDRDSAMVALQVEQENLSQQLGSPARFVPSAVAASPASRYTKVAPPLDTQADALSMAAGTSSFSPASAGTSANLSANALQQWHDAQQREIARLFEESQKMQQSLTAQHQQEDDSAHWASNAQNDAVIQTSQSAALKESAGVGYSCGPGGEVEPAKVAASMLPKPDPPSTPGRGPEAEADSTRAKVATPGSAKKSVDWESAAALALARSQGRVSSSPVRTPKRSVAGLAPPTPGSDIDGSSDSAARKAGQGGVSNLHRNAAISHSSSKLTWPKAPASPGSPNRTVDKQDVACQPIPSLVLPIPSPAQESISSAVAFKQEAAKLLKTPPRTSASGAFAVDSYDPELAALGAESDGSGKDRYLLARSPRGKTAMLLAVANEDEDSKRFGNARVAARDKALWAAAAEHATVVATGRLSRAPPALTLNQPSLENEPEPMCD